MTSRPAIGLGLPVVEPAELVAWGRDAEAAGFATVAVLDRWAWDNAEPLIALAGIATATERVALRTEVLLAPLRDPVLLAKQAATLDRLSRGRLSLGVGVGGRADDFAAAGVPLGERGRRMDAALEALRARWSGAGAGAPVGPSPWREGGPEVLIGAFAPAALARVARHADGLIASAAPHRAAALFDAVRDGWAAAGRDGSPRLVAQLDVALGPAATVADAARRMTEYYAFLGPDHDPTTRLRTDASAIAEAIAAYAALGADEVVLFCWDADRGQVERLVACTRA
jgi:alkanesulfonate monooxygenase SsuD/methylene tetrahydromethanopterin reductase-like flavin-dependent oxidoreductase (luciferase family)